MTVQLSQPMHHCCRENGQQSKELGPLVASPKTKQADEQYGFLKALFKKLAGVRGRPHPVLQVA